MLTRGQKIGAVLSILGLVLAAALMTTQESIAAGGVFALGVLLTALLVAGVVEASHGDQVARLLERIEMLKRHACCGCGHKLERHRDPRSADGLGCLDCNCQALHRLDESLAEPYLPHR